MESEGGGRYPCGDDGGNCFGGIGGNDIDGETSAGAALICSSSSTMMKGSSTVGGGVLLGDVPGVVSAAKFQWGVDS